MHFRSITVALRLLVGMPPKVKSLEAMAAAEVEETQATQPADQLTPNLTQPEDPSGAGPSLEAPKPMAKNGKSKKLRASASILATDISNDLEIHPFIVQRIEQANQSIS